MMGLAPTLTLLPKTLIPKRLVPKTLFAMMARLIPMMAMLIPKTLIPKRLIPMGLGLLPDLLLHLLEAESYWTPLQGTSRSLP